MPARVRPPVGAHVRVSGGLARGGLAYAVRVGAEAVQVFASNPRGWAASPGDPRQDEAFRHGCAERGWPVFVHAPYLVNLGSPDAVTVRRSVAALRHALSRAGVLGARGVVVHTGSAVDEAHRPAALRQVRRRLRPLLDRLSEAGPDLLLEPTAGQGRSLCASVPELGEYLDLLDRHPKVGVCLDTCHVFAAGADLTAPGAVGRLLAELDRVAGAGRLRLVHANDSQDGCGSQRDRHANIGAGQIGLPPFRALLRHQALRGVPVVVETPGGAEGHAADVATLRRLRDR